MDSVVELKVWERKVEKTGIFCFVLGAERGPRPLLFCPKKGRQLRAAAPSLLLLTGDFDVIL